MVVRRMLGLVVCGCVALVLVCGCENKLSALKRATRLAGKKRYTEAVAAYQHYIEVVGDSPQSAYERAEAYYQIGRLYTYFLKEPDKGRRAFEQAVTIRPDYADPQAHLGIMYRFMNPPMLDKAETALRAALEARPEITEYFISPNAVQRPRIILASLEQRHRRLNEAIAQLYTYEHYSDNDGEDWYELGQLFLTEKDYPKALFYYKRAFDALTKSERGTSRYFTTRFGLIQAYTRNGLFPEAQEILDESFDILDQHSVFYRSLARWRGSEADDLKGWLTATRLNLLKQQSVVHVRLAQYDEAIGALKEVHALVPGARGVLIELAELYAKNGDYQLAREELAKFKRLAPRDMRALQTEAIIFYEQQRYDEFLQRIEQLITLSPATLSPQTLRALALVKAGRADEGIAQIEAVCRKYPNLPQLQLRMAEALAAAGKPSLAFWWLRRAMDTGLILPTRFQTDRELQPLLADPGFPKLVNDMRYRISLRQRIHEAEDLLYQGETARGLGALERLHTQNPDVMFAAYALARGYVFADKPDDAFPLLTECAQAGLFNPSTLKSDGYLTELHDDPRFVQLFSAIQQPWPDESSE